MRCLVDLHVLPNEYLALDQESKAFLIASLIVQDEEMEKENRRIEQEANRGY